MFENLFSLPRRRQAPQTRPAAKIRRRPEPQPRIRWVG
jgi:hypothetical protein